MKVNEILELGKMGFTKDEILKIAGQKQEEKPVEAKEEKTVEVKEEKPVEVKETPTQEALTADVVSNMIAEAIKAVNIKSAVSPAEAVTVDDIIDIFLG